MHARLTPRTLPARAGHPITAAHRPVCPGRRPAAADRQPAHTEGLARRTTAELSPSVTKRRSGTRRTQRRTASATCRLKSACSCSFAAGTFPHPCGSVCSTDAMDRGSDARRRETPRLPVQDGCRTPWTSGTIVDGGRLTHNPEVAGSNPAPATKLRGRIRTRIRPLAFYLRPVASVAVPGLDANMLLCAPRLTCPMR